jgi:uncharacterized protein YkwD
MKLKKLNFRLPKFAFSIPTRTRQLIVIAILGSLCAWAILYSPQMETWRQQWSVRLRATEQKLRAPLQSLTTNIPYGKLNPLEKPQLIEVTNSDILHAALTVRVNNTLKPLTENTVLSKLARLTALEAEEQGTLDVPDNTATLLRSLTPTPPEKVEIIILFAPSIGVTPNLEEQLASSSGMLNKSMLYIGIATRSATFDNVSGTLAAIAVSSGFSTRAPQPQTNSGATRPTFTGQDLWKAVQNYRSAHGLFVFEQSNELCTVASIRVNELLELGKLDNHDGFKRRSDEFFERNPGWTAINENIAAGYQTAVQTVEWGWDQSLGHQALIQSKEYPKACAAANSGFSVLITGK